MVSFPRGVDGTGGGGHGEARLMGLAGSLEDLIGSYERAVELLYHTEANAPSGPWLRRVRARVDRLFDECHARAMQLADTPASTPAGSAVKSRALQRYWDVLVECDPFGQQVMHALCADIRRLAAGAPTPLGEVLRP